MKSFIYPPGKRILQIAHNHPSFSPGGTELVAHALHREALERGHDSWFLAAAEPIHLTPNLGTQMVAISGDHRESAIFAPAFSRFDFAQPDSGGFLWELQRYIEAVKPDIVHFHHLLNFGLESLFLIRSMLPQAEIYFTLHDYYAICADNGQLYHHETGSRCSGPSLRNCAKCVASRSVNDFTLRRISFENALACCDRIFSPSHFLKDMIERHLALPVPIEVLENGYFGPDIAPAALPDSAEGEVQFGYMGNISAIKGLPDLLDACDLLAGRGEVKFRLHVHGSQLFEDKTLAERIERSKNELKTSIRYYGRYAQADVARCYGTFECLVFPSVWWENAPLVLYEALHHQRDIVAYPHGGGAEFVRRHGRGLLAEQSDPQSLADAMETAARTILARRQTDAKIAVANPEATITG